MGTVCTSPIYLDMSKASPRVKAKFPDGLMVPCGRCVGCRKQRSLEWAIRLEREMPYWQSAVFVTYTYSEEKLPFSGVFPTLLKSDMQKYFKRLRKQLGKRKIMYYQCGEYGDKNGRPHYHAIIFGLDIMSDSAMIVDTWEKGIVDIGVVTTASCRYVAQYIDKKLYGDRAKEEYDLKGRERPYVVMSKGIGKKYALENANRLLANGTDTYSGKKVGIPRYYKNIIGMPENQRKELGDKAFAQQVKTLKKKYGKITHDIYHAHLRAVMHRKKYEGLSEEKNKPRNKNKERML